MGILLHFVSSVAQRKRDVRNMMKRSGGMVLHGRYYLDRRGICILKMVV